MLEFKDLDDFKARGEKIVKKYPEPLHNCIFVGEWILGYVTEENFFKTQRILSISHRNRSPFDITTPFNEILGLSDMFKYSVVIYKTFENRGFTCMYVINK